MTSPQAIYNSLYQDMYLDVEGMINEVQLRLLPPQPNKFLHVLCGPLLVLSADRLSTSSVGVGVLRSFLRGGVGSFSASPFGWKTLRDLTQINFIIVLLGRGVTSSSIFITASLLGLCSSIGTITAMP